MAKAVAGDYLIVSRIDGGRYLGTNDSKLYDTDRKALSAARGLHEPYWRWVVMVLTFEHGKGTMTMLPASAITELEFTTSIDKEIDEAEDRIKWLTNDRAENKKKGYWDAREENWYQNDLGESDKRIARLKSYRYPDLYFK